MNTVPTPAADALARAAALWADPDHPSRAAAVDATLAAQGAAWTFEAVTFAVNQTMSVLTPEAIAAWQAGRTAAAPVTVGVLHAGNIPMGEVQDVAAVLLAGHRYRGVVSSRAPHLLPAFLTDVVRESGGAVDARIVSFDAMLAEAARGGAVVATGSDETREAVAERCDAVGIPADRRLLRGHRISVAVVDGEETEAEREGLAEDVLLHEGAGCRSIAVVLAPPGLSPDLYFAAFAAGRGVYPAPPATAAGLRMAVSLARATQQPHAALDDGSLLVTRGDPEAQRAGHLRWSEMADVGAAAAWVAAHADTLQLVAARPGLHAALVDALAATGVSIVALGDTQRPPLDWRPDGIDTLGWLAAL